MNKRIRIAAVVCRCPVGEVARNLDRTRHWTLQAKRTGAALVCFPEMNLTGYSNRRQMADHAISARGPEIDALRRLSAEQAMALLVGFAEKAPKGRLFASHMVITPSGHTGLYRKLHLAPPEAKHFTAGKDLPLFSWFTEITGFVFHDTNGNGRKDPGEDGIPDFALQNLDRTNNLFEQGQNG